MTSPPLLPSPIPSNIDKSEQNNDQQQNLLQPGIIAAIILACLAVLGACIAIFWVMRQSRRRRKLVYGEKGHLGTSFYIIFVILFFF